MFNSIFSPLCFTIFQSILNLSIGSVYSFFTLLSFFVCQSLFYLFIVQYSHFNPFSLLSLRLIFSRPTTLQLFRIISIICELCQEDVVSYQVYLCSSIFKTGQLISFSMLPYAFKNFSVFEE